MVYKKNIVLLQSKLSDTFGYGIIIFLLLLQLICFSLFLIVGHTVILTIFLNPFPPFLINIKLLALVVFCKSEFLVKNTSFQQPRCFSQKNHMEYTAFDYIGTTRAAV